MDFRIASAFDLVLASVMAEEEREIENQRKRRNG